MSTAEGIDLKEEPVAHWTKSLTKEGFDKLIGSKLNALEETLDRLESKLEEIGDYYNTRLQMLEDKLVKVENSLKNKDVTNSAQNEPSNNKGCDCKKIVHNHFYRYVKVKDVCIGCWNEK
ncbi:MAG TPA: hypothetical protein VGK47_03135 [Nitrososphaeraceae archaeon]